MRIVSFRASSGRYLALNAEQRLAALEAAPSQLTEFLITNLTRPMSDRIAVGDRLEIRCLANNNVWRLDMSRFTSSAAPTLLVVDRTVGDFAKTKSEAISVTRVDVDDQGQFRVRLSASMPSMQLLSGGGGRTDTETLFRRGHEVLREAALGFDGAGQLQGTWRTPAGGEEFTLVPHVIRAVLRAQNGLALTMNSDGRLVGMASDVGRIQEFTLVPPDDANGSRLLHAELFRLRAPNGLQCTLRDAVAVADTPSGVLLQVLRVAGAGAVEDSETVEIVGFEVGRRPDVQPMRLHFDPSAGARTGRVAMRRAERSADSTFRLELTRPLRLFFNAVLGDNALGMGDAGGGGYEPVRPQVRVWIAPQPDTVALKSLWHAGRGDTMATATVHGELEAAAVVPPYQYRQVLGYVHTSSQPGTVPLKQYWHGGLGDNFLAASELDERSASSAGYGFGWIEGHARLAVAAEPVPSPGFTVTPHTLRPGVLDGPVVSIPIGGAAPGRPLRALVLSGGGAKGCFEAGAVQALWQDGYRPDFICGVSVGAINATYLALGHDTAADELVAQWREFSAAPGRIYRESHYANVAGSLLGRVGGRASDTLLATAAGAAFGAAIGGAIGFFAIKDASGLDAATVRAINYTLTMSHALHSMEPLRRLLRRTLDADFMRRLRESAIGLHVGITDMKSGQYITASKPRREWTDAMLSDCASLHAEPDHQLGQTWLTRPIHGLPYVMPLVDAVYASSALPAFMEPMQVDLAASRRIDTAAGSFVRLSTGLPFGLAELLEATNASSDTGTGYLESVDWARVERTIDELLSRLPMAALRNNVPMTRPLADGQRGRQSQTHLLFDGGLRDTLPIRTALRLGATEITVITGDQLQRAQHGYPLPKRLDPALAGGLLDLLDSNAFEGTDIGATPLAQHVLGLLGLWYNEASRTDLLLAMAQTDRLHVLQRATQLMDAPSASRFRNEVHATEARRAATRYRVLGATEPIGGTPETPHAFGTPFVSGGASVRIIAPDRNFIDALSFEDAQAVEDGIALGRERARTPEVL